MEQLRMRYPYEPGKAGVPFEKILQISRDGQQEGTIISGSERKLNFEALPHTLCIRDSEFPDRVMRASIYDEAIVFGLQTKISGLDYVHRGKEFPWEKHPDMFAGKFVEFALKYFVSNGTRFDRINSSWTEGSDEYRSYKEELKRNGDRVKAAKNTWSGQIFAKYGYSEVSERDISVKWPEDNREYIFVNFRRKQ